MINHSTHDIRFTHRKTYLYIHIQHIHTHFLDDRKISPISIFPLFTRVPPVLTTTARQWWRDIEANRTVAAMYPLIMCGSVAIRVGQAIMT